jgi:cyclomaltodextrinase
MKKKPALTMLFFVKLAAFACQVAAQAEQFSQVPARTPPAWLRNGVIYEVFPRVFSAEGDLNGITEQLDRLHDLGVTILWTMPIHPIGEKLRNGEFGSPYAIKDYYAVDPAYGTVNDYKRLVAEAHRRGLKVIMDLVSVHTAWDNALTKHPEFYNHDSRGNVIPPVPDWKDVAGLNYGNPGLRQYMIAMLKYWIQSCDVDGFRCDSAAMAPTDFWEQVRAELTPVKPDIILLAEASKPELLVKAFDVDYAWPLLHTLNNVLINGASASSLRASWEESQGEFPRNSLHLLMSDNHDEVRAVSRFGIRGALAASVLMFTLDGVPLLYNGMEVGDATESGGGALFARVPIFWSPPDRPPLRQIYHDLTWLRKEEAAFRNGRVIWLHNSNEESLVTFKRAEEKNEFVVVINFSNRPINGKIEVGNGENFKPVRIAGMPLIPNHDFPFIHLGGFDWCIYHRSLPSVEPVVSGTNHAQVEPPR